MGTGGTKTGVNVGVGARVFVAGGVSVGVFVGNGRIGVPPTTMVAPGVVPKMVNRFDVGSYCAMNVIPRELGVNVPATVGLGGETVGAIVGEISVGDGALPQATAIVGNRNKQVHVTRYWTRVQVMNADAPRK